MTQPAGAMGGPVTYQVTQSVEGQGLVNGQFVKGVSVQFTLSNGHAGSVFVRESDYTPDKVSAAVQAKARAMVAVAGLTGTV